MKHIFIALIFLNLAWGAEPNSGFGPIGRLAPYIEESQVCFSTTYLRGKAVSDFIPLPLKSLIFTVEGFGRTSPPLESEFLEPLNKAISGATFSVDPDSILSRKDYSLSWRAYTIYNSNNIARLDMYEGMHGWHHLIISISPGVSGIIKIKKESEQDAAANP